MMICKASTMTLVTEAMPYTVLMQLQLPFFSRKCTQAASDSGELTTNSIASIATIAIVASGGAAITTVVATVATSSIGFVTIVVTTVASVATNSNIAAAATTASLLVHIVVACISIETSPDKDEMSWYLMSN